LLAHGQWFSPCTPASSTTKLGCQDIPKILLKVMLNTINQSINHVEREVGNGLQYSVDGKEDTLENNWSDA
jgi:hypothetical protein